MRVEEVGARPTASLRPARTGGKAGPDCSKEPARAFGKPGRPSEDRVGRQQEIFLAVAPLIRELGTREITMARAAEAASLSIGGLYHYFGTKRELLLFGLSPENLERLCTDFREQHAELLRDDPRAFLDASLENLTRQADAFVTPTVLAAMQLGVETLRDRLESALETEVVGLVQVVRAAYPQLAEAAAKDLNRALRRQCFSALLDPQITPHQLHAQLVGTVAAFTRPARGVGRR
jgi:AcrR family transcriptional regulator